MIVYDFDPGGTGLAPDKTDPPRLIHTNAVFSRSVALQRFESIARRRTQSGQRRRRVQHVQLASDCLGNGAPPSGQTPSLKNRSVLASAKPTITVDIYCTYRVTSREITPSKPRASSAHCPIEQGRHRMR